MIMVQETEFREALVEKLSVFCPSDFDFVTGPGRSGSVAAVYASHLLGIPYVPYKANPTGRYLVVDTTSKTGRTLRKAAKKYNAVRAVVMFHQTSTTDRLRFWYEELSLPRGKGHEYVS